MRQRINNAFLVWVGLVSLVLISPGQAEANSVPGQGERYFMAVFGYQDSANRLVKSHTFASFATLSELQRGIAPEALSTISWLPATGGVRLFQWQPGYNFNLPQTLAIAASLGDVSIQIYGPFEITPELYRRAKAQIAYLRPQNVWYKMIDGCRRPGAGCGGTGGALNCIHALSDIGGFLSTGTLRGFSATAAVAQHLSCYIVHYPMVHPDVARAMHLPELLGRRF